jgi:hypothetical protein
MADPLSFAASILAVIQITDEVLTRCYIYVGRVKSAASEIDRTVQESSLLKGLLLNLHQLALEEPDNPRLETLVAPAGALSICTEELKKIEAKLQPLSKTLTTKRRLLWPFESKGLEQILERIRLQKPALLLALATDNLDATRKIQDGVKNIQASLDSAQSQDKREKILTWLRPLDPKEKHIISRQEHEEGTNQWILDHPDFRKWLEESKENIWVSLDRSIFQIIILGSVLILISAAAWHTRLWQDNHVLNHHRSCREALSVRNRTQNGILLF